MYFCTLHVQVFLLAFTMTKDARSEMFQLSNSRGLKHIYICSMGLAMSTLVFLDNLKGFQMFDWKYFLKIFISDIFVRRRVSMQNER